MRLIDLHIPWLLQYAPETTLFEPDLYPEVPARLPQIEGYLQTTWAAVGACGRCSEDWARQADSWPALGELITRYEAEFSGRLLLGPEDHARWLADPNGLCWAVLGVSGCDVLVRGPADLDRLPPLFERGVRLFQPVATAAGALGGSSEPGDDRGLTDLGRAFLDTLLDLGPLAPNEPRPALDLAHLGPQALADVLDWFEADAQRSERLVPVLSHGVTVAPNPGTGTLSLEPLRRLRALGGVVGLSVGRAFHDTPDALKRAIETLATLSFLGRNGFEGLALGSGFLTLDPPTPGLDNAPNLVAWLRSAFDPATASALIQRNGLRLIERLAGATTG